MRVRGFLGVLSGLALGACVVMTNDGDRDPPTGNFSGASGNAGRGGSSGASGSAGTSGRGGSGGTTDAGTDGGSAGAADANADSATDVITTDGTTTDGTTTDGGGADDGADPSLGVHCSAIVAACPLLAVAECRLYLAGLTAAARARVVACMTSGCNLAACVRDL